MFDLNADCFVLLGYFSSIKPKLEGWAASGPSSQPVFPSTPRSYIAKILLWQLKFRFEHDSGTVLSQQFKVYFCTLCLCLCPLHAIVLFPIQLRVSKLSRSVLIPAVTF